MKFSELGIHAPILKALTEAGYERPTPIQEQAVPPVLAGRDLLGCAQTGTGKTAAFSVPILQRLSEKREHALRALILTPTRELALQIYENVCQYARYTPCTAAVIFGGVSQIPQVEALQRGADVLIATPGRLWDLMGQKLVSLDKIECFVLDEADRMLDMGFINDVKKIVKCIPENRQTLLFSATMPKEIAALADSLLKKPVKISITPAATPVELIEQQVYYVERAEKRELLKTILQQKNLPQTLVFTRTKHGADRVARDLNRAGISARSLHGDKSQGARQAALRDFKAYKIVALVATDIAARGLDISELPLVINFEIPNIPETYVHRIGRTGRAGMEGMAISFCDTSERPYLADIEKLTRQRIPVVGEIEHVPQPHAAEPPVHQPAPRRRRAAAVEAAEPIIPAVPAAPEALRAKTPRRRRAAAVSEPVAAAVPETAKAPRRRRSIEPKPAEPVQAEPIVAAVPEAPRKPSRRRAAAPAQAEPVIAAVPEAPRAKAPRRRAAGNSAPASNPKTAAPARGRTTRSAARRRSRDRYEDNTRVDIATPVNLNHISDETAARIRAKVEAKLAERALARSSMAKPEKKPAARRPSRGRGRR